ncbi:MAG TPA: hypothetical protein VF064_12070 [Pyrinomonadaceae bacterium]
MEIENILPRGRVEARGALCVECLSAVAPAGAVLDRTGAALCRACAAEFYTACAACAGLVPRDEALARDDVGGGDESKLYCAECFRAAAFAAEEAEPVSDEEVTALVAEFVALHAEKKRLDARVEEIKERLKVAARARPRVAGAVVLRAGEDAGVRCSYSVRTTYDAGKLEAVEAMLGGAEFAALFERKVTYSPVRNSLEEFLASSDDEHGAAREAIRAAAQHTETATLNVVAQKKQKKAAKADEPQ